MVPVVMAAGIGFGVFRGRYVCGNLCPRGAFLGTVLPLLSRNRPIPAVLFRLPFRWTVFALLMGFMALRLWRGPLTIAHVGIIFWQMCALTSALAVALALIRGPRSWCAMCPMGTAQRALGGGKSVPRIDESLCKKCALCEAACPLNLPLVQPAQDKSLDDCMQCGKCAAACPAKAIK
ncbi:MAG: 4Fe-4S binding protein [Elusimicrobiales bacterium]|nr:4Fe-4S binding protein [Elusimicrobiales bacterium]